MTANLAAVEETGLDAVLLELDGFFMLREKELQALQAFLSEQHVFIFAPYWFRQQVKHCTSRLATAQPRSLSPPMHR